MSDEQHAPGSIVITGDPAVLEDTLNKILASFERTERMVSMLYQLIVIGAQAATAKVPAQAGEDEHHD